MIKSLYRILIQLIDGACYGIIGPFSLLYIIPQFIMKITNIKSEDGFGFLPVKITGMVFMWSGLVLAIYCAILMFLFAEGTPIVTSAPKKMLARNIYKYVRNPMMWSLFMIMFGEALTFGQWILFLWLIVMYRIIYLIVVNYEEPQLERRFGEEWVEYCKEVPRWLPRR
jgi:protein-S-isoprenylcysteine O-methyltransferase Ste14